MGGVKALRFAGADRVLLLWVIGGYCAIALESHLATAAACVVPGGVGNDHILGEFLG